MLKLYRILGTVEENKAPIQYNLSSKVKEILLIMHHVYRRIFIRYKNQIESYVVLASSTIGSRRFKRSFSKSLEEGWKKAEWFV